MVGESGMKTEDDIGSLVNFDFRVSIVICLCERMPCFIYYSGAPSADQNM